MSPECRNGGAKNSTGPTEKNDQELSSAPGFISQRTGFRTLSRTHNSGMCKLRTLTFPGPWVLHANTLHFLIYFPVYRHKHLIIPLKKGIMYFTYITRFVCLSVCLSVITFAARWLDLATWCQVRSILSTRT